MAFWLCPDEFECKSQSFLFDKKVLNPCSNARADPFLFDKKVLSHCATVQQSVREMCDALKMDWLPIR
jgi:hypothetical protein